MKESRFKTSKGEFIILDLPTDTIELQDIYLNGISWKDNTGHWDTWYSENEEETIYFISSLKEITEEQASEIVDYKVEETEFQGGGLYNTIYNYEKGDFELGNSQIESLYSLLKSKGIHLFENPENLPHSLEYCSSRWTYYGYEVRKYREAETKTFYNPCIFKIS